MEETVRNSLRFVKVPIVLAICLLTTGLLYAQSTSSELKELKDAVAAQQQQIQQLQQQVQSRDAAIQQLQQQVGQAQSAATQAQKDAAAAALAQAPKSSEEIAALEHQVTDLKAVTANTVEGLQDTQKRVSDLESPLAIHYKGILITPGGFLAGETYWRSHATYGEATALNAIPFSAAGQARTSEFYGSGRQSRLSLLAQGKWGTTNLTGYVEADFLGVGITSNPNQSNSYVFRQRQVWGQAAFHNGWTFTGGQMWSLVMETRKGLDNRTEATPLQIDPNYTAGMSWTRQFGFRAVKNFNNKWWVGMSVENSQILETASGNASNFLIGGPGTGGGLYNSTANYSSNVSPDYVLKVAFEPGFGHYEVFGLASPMRNRIYPNATAVKPSAAGAFNQTIWGGGIGANARWLFYQKHIETGIHYLGGKGIGRYGDTTLADVTVNPQGQLKALQNYQVLASLEWHSPKWDWYGYGGGEYDGKTWYGTKPGGQGPVGYGSPFFNNTGCGTETLPSAGNGFGPGALGSCTANIKSIVEGTTGFWYKPYNGPKGRLQMGMQYSYLVRTAWVGYGPSPFTIPFPFPSATIAPKAIENMWMTSFRYYLP
jgi:outer membrane murein-binding lipoprotein Lpp